MNDFCSIEERDDLCTRYVTGDLADAELESFEAHFLTCTQCTASVHEALALRAALNKRRALRRARLAVPIMFAAAAAVSWLILAPSALEKLGRIEPPAVRPMEVRAAADSAELASERGLTAMQSRQWHAAQQFFARSYALDAQPATAYYLGLSSLLRGDADSALVSLHTVLQASSATYRNDALYYRAKAWLQRANPDSALVQLSQLRSSGNLQWAERAKSLADSIAGLH